MTNAEMSLPREARWRLEYNTSTRQEYAQMLEALRQSVRETDPENEERLCLLYGQISRYRNLISECDAEIALLQELAPPDAA